MREQINVKISDAYIRIIKNGFPLLTKEMFQPSHTDIAEGSLLRLIDKKGQFLATAYYGIQNKGLGWILTDKKEQIDTGFFATKFAQAFQKRAELFSDRQTTAFRVFNGEGDGIGGLVMEYFAGYYVIHWYSEGIYTFKKEIIEALKNQSACKGIYEKKRFHTGGKYVESDDFVWGVHSICGVFKRRCNGRDFS